MNNNRVSTWLNYHRAFEKVSLLRLAKAINKSDRTYRARMNDINSLTLGECKAILEELKLNRASKEEFFQEVVHAWYE